LFILSIRLDAFLLRLYTYYYRVWRKNMAVIYRITNMLTEDFYIGSTQSFERRTWQHRYDLRRNCHKNPHMQASWNKYGEDAFVFEVLEDVEDGDAMLEVENRYLHECVGLPNCFNVNRDAVASRLGQTMSEKSRAQLSKNRKGKAAGSDHYRYGQTVSEEIRVKISAAMAGRLSPMKGKKMSEQGRANVAAAVKRGPDSPAYGKRPTNAEDLQRAVTVRFPEGREETFDSLTYIRDTFGVSINTTVRACKSRARVERGVFAGHQMWYADEAPTPVDEVPEEYRGFPRTRTEAKRLGAKKYFTGEPCTHGHVAPRYTKGQCVVCAAEEQRAKARRNA
jgi:group I intron endonuclease